MTSRHRQRPRRHQASQQLSAVADGLAGHRITIRHASIGDMPS